MTTKGYFVFNFEGKISEIHDEENLETFLSRINSLDEKEMGTLKFLHSYLTGGNLPIFKKDYPIPFKLHLIYDIEPKSIPTDKTNTSISFKIKTEILDIDSVKNKEVIYIDPYNNNKVKIILDNNTELIKNSVY